MGFKCSKGLTLVNVLSNYRFTSSNRLVIELTQFIINELFEDKAEEGEEKEIQRKSEK